MTNQPLVAINTNFPFNLLCRVWGNTIFCLTMITIMKAIVSLGTTNNLTAANKESQNCHHWENGMEKFLHMFQKNQTFQFKVSSLSKVLNATKAYTIFAYFALHHICIGMQNIKLMFLVGRWVEHVLLRCLTFSRLGVWAWTVRNIFLDSPIIKIKFSFLI